MQGLHQACLLVRGACTPHQQAALSAWSLPQASAENGPGPTPARDDSIFECVRPPLVEHAQDSIPVRPPGACSHHQARQLGFRNQAAGGPFDRCCAALSLTCAAQSCLAPPTQNAHGSPTCRVHMITAARWRVTTRPQTWCCWSMPLMCLCRAQSSRWGRRGTHWNHAHNSMPVISQQHAFSLTDSLPLPCRFWIASTRLRGTA